MKRLIAVALVASSMMCVTTAVAHAEDIGGLILVTRVIFEDSQLVDHVVCAETARPCIDFGASHITLRLNGFTMTGPAQPDVPADALSCPTVQPALADGIRIQNQTHARVLGPGMVQSGVLIQAGATDNVIRRNVIAGNPPSQISRASGPAIGFDIRDESLVVGSGDRNTIERNWCIAYSGPGPVPCPHFPGPGPTDNKR